MRARQIIRDGCHVSLIIKTTIAQIMVTPRIPFEAFSMSKRLNSRKKKTFAKTETLITFVKTP